ncbi:hypothetical protein FKW77_005774 [Venturia effusa]|uniref:Ubiquitin 3 binding protein But2 C-terminal domain-containing protein n=1 Tax=Venturia effusa TaxID=50376 RepID=A0A517LIU3_9PEZI|nr:hypothetical protein FKW77_005774 [Venturia effusa]
MKTSLLSTVLLSGFTSLISALPTAETCLPLTSPFLLVTTSTPNCGPSTILPNVSAISVYDPNHSTTLYLRTILPGYNSLPNFTLADGALQTNATGPFGLTTQLYNSTAVAADQSLGFAAAANPAGGLSLSMDYLLANNDDTEGWTLCNDSFGESVIAWQGTDPSCTPTYVQATNTPPY